MPDIRSEFDRLDSVYKADTLAEAAQMAGLNAQALQETVNIYNGYCSSGVDEEFDKAAEYLIPVGDGPYYLVEVADGYYTTVGGIRISPNMEVLGSEFEPIPGLYAGGSDAGGLYGDSYDVSCSPGSQASWAVNSGRLAALNASAYLKA
jgi:fumarate reductase flavoprotein subunit